MQVRRISQLKKQATYIITVQMFNEPKCKHTYMRAWMEVVLLCVGGVRVIVEDVGSVWMFSRYVLGYVMAPTLEIVNCGQTTPTLRVNEAYK